jgi:hypothetical protein
MELDNFEAAKKMLEEGLGVALLPIVAVERELELGQLASVPIVDAGPVHRRMVVIRRNDVGPAGGIAQAFLDILLEMVGSRPLAGMANGTAAGEHGNGAATSPEAARQSGTILSLGARLAGLAGE